MTTQTPTKKSYILDELMRNSPDYSDDETLATFNKVQRQLLSGVHPSDTASIEMHAVLEYLTVDDFNPRYWALMGAIKRSRNSYGFINDKSGEMFYLRVNRTGTVSPLHAHYRHMRKAPSIDEAISRFIY